MATNYVQSGEVLDYTNGTGSEIASGQVVVIGSLVGVAASTIADGSTGAVHVGGVWNLPKVTAAEIAAGETVIWDVSAGAFDDNAATPAVGDLVGGCVAVGAAANGEATVSVKLNVGVSSVTPA